MSTTDSAVGGGPVAAPVFSRNATGLVRLGTPYRMLVANVVNVGVTYAAFYFWLVPGNFPETSLIPAVLLTIPFGVAFLTCWALLAIMDAAQRRREVRTPRRSQLIGVVVGVVYGAIVLIILLAMSKGVGLDFNDDAAWVSLDAPDAVYTELPPD